MKGIVAPIKGMQSLLAAERFNERTVYTRTRFCLEADCPDGHLLYNTLTGELLLIEPADEMSDLRETLVEKRFFVPSDFDEHSHARQLKDVIRLLQRPKQPLTSFTIFTTTDCNARCPYCYERGIARKTMGAQVARDVARYVAEACKGERVSIHWFGGEPLCNSSAIDEISGALTCHQVSFVSRLTSNGFYLDADTAARAARDWHVRQVQITLDGTEDTYNRTKAYADADGSGYKRVLRNIGHALDAGMEVHVRLNMDAANVDELHLVCDELAARFADQHHLTAQVALLADMNGAIGGVHAFADDEEMVRSYVGLAEHVAACGLASPKRLPRQLLANRCKADNLAAEVILPDGQVARCEHVDETEHVGDIYNPWRDEAIVASWAKRVEYPQCAECPLYPQCTPLDRCAWDAGGCGEAKRAIRLFNYRARVLAEFGRYKRGAR